MEIFFAKLLCSLVSVAVVVEFIEILFNLASKYILGRYKCLKREDVAQFQ